MVIEKSEKQPILINQNAILPPLRLPVVSDNEFIFYTIGYLDLSTLSSQSNGLSLIRFWGATWPIFWCL